MESQSIFLDWKPQSDKSLDRIGGARKIKEANYKDCIEKYARKYRKIWGKKHNEVILALQILTYIINLTELKLCSTDT